MSSFKVEQNIESLKESINSLSSVKRDGPTIIHIDNIFSVKGVGVVVLGMLKQGVIKVQLSTYYFLKRKRLQLRVYRCMIKMLKNHIVQ